MPPEEFPTYISVHCQIMPKVVKSRDSRVVVSHLVFGGWGYALCAAAHRGSPHIRNMFMLTAVRCVCVGTQNDQTIAVLGENEARLATSKSCYGTGGMTKQLEQSP